MLYRREEKRGQERERELGRCVNRQQSYLNSTVLSLSHSLTHSLSHWEDNHQSSNHWHEIPLAWGSGGGSSSSNSGNSSNVPPTAPARSLAPASPRLARHGKPPHLPLLSILDAHKRTLAAIRTRRRLLL